MKAGRFYGARDVRVEEVDYPKLEPEGIILRVEYCGICGTEVHYYKRGIYDFKQEALGAGDNHTPHHGARTQWRGS